MVFHEKEVSEQIIINIFFQIIQIAGFVIFC